MLQNAQLAKLFLLWRVANSSRKLAKDPLARRNTSLSNKFILHRDTCCRRHFHRGFALNTTRCHDQRQIMLEYEAVTFAPAYLLGSLDACSPQVTSDTNRPAGPGNPARRELGRALTRRWCSSTWPDHDDNMEQRAVAHDGKKVKTLGVALLRRICHNETVLHLQAALVEHRLP